MHVTLRTADAKIIAEHDSRTADLRTSLARCAHKAGLGYQRPYVVNRCNGGDTYHVQFGETLRTGGVTLGDLYVAQVRRD